MGLALSVHPGRFQAITERLWAEPWASNIVRLTSPEHTHGRQQDMELKEGGIVGLMPGACFSISYP